MQDHVVVILSEPAWAVGGRLILTGGRCDPWLPREDMIGLFKHFQAGRKIKNH